MQCRACTKNKSQILVDMAVPCTDDGKCLFDYFNECTQLHASPKDSFPKTLCKMCAQKLQIAYNFRKCARQSEEFFHKFLIPNGMETEAIIFPPSDRLSLKEEVVVEPDFPGENICAENLIVETEEMETRLSPEAIETECVYAELLCEVSEYKLEKEALSESEEEDKDSNIENYQDTTTPESYFDATEEQCGDFYSSEFMDIEKVERQENAEDIKPMGENENELVCEQSNDISEILYLNESNDEKSLCNEEEEESEDETLERMTYLCEPQNEIDDNYSAKTFVGKRKKINESKQNGRKPMRGEAGLDTARANNKQQEVQKTSPNKRTNINVKKKQKLLCSFCPRILSSKPSLEAHEGKHLNIKRDLKECPMCQKKYSQEYLKNHILAVHHGERKYTCDICGDSYKTQALLGRHKLLHTKERPLACPLCDKRFTEQSHIKVHMRIHTGELPFECDLCGRRFRIRVHLTYHLKQHANIKHKCEVCGKEFKHSKSLKDHSYLHTGVMPYTCTFCDYGSPKREYFVKHMMSKHKTSMTADELFAMFKANTGRSPHVKLAEEMEKIKRKVQP